MEKVEFFCNTYKQEKARWLNFGKGNLVNNFVNRVIKWTSELESHLVKGFKLTYNKKFIIDSIYRPYVNKKLYYNRIIIHRLYQLSQILPNNQVENKIITFSGTSSSKPFAALATDKIFSLDTIEKTQCLPLYRYDKDGNRIDNITDWGLEQFQNYYNDSTITKLDIFHYTYAVLHNPAYRTKYELNLKREFPRLPFYNDFHQWVSLGKQLMDLHINYETVEPYSLSRIDLPLADDTKGTPKVKLKADKTSGIILLDEVTTLAGIPKEAWNYQLGNRSALEWILDQYKEKKPKDPTIAEKFNTYRFADYKVQVIDLLQRVCTVSVETMRIIQEMEG
jgi:predicted helicase